MKDLQKALSIDQQLTEALRGEECPVVRLSILRTQNVRLKRTLLSLKKRNCTKMH